MGDLNYNLGLMWPQTARPEILRRMATQLHDASELVRNANTAINDLRSRNPAELMQALDDLQRGDISQRIQEMQRAMDALADQVQGSIGPIGLDTDLGPVPDITLEDTPDYSDLIPGDAPDWDGEPPDAIALNKIPLPDIRANVERLTPPSDDDLHVDPPEGLSPDDLHIPDPPALDAIYIPPAPDIDLDKVDMPVWEGERPVIKNNTFVRDATIATEAARDVAEESLTDAAVLLDKVFNAGEGYIPAVEQALIDRTLARTERDAQRAIDEAVSAWAERGFTLPGSTVLAQVAAVQEQNNEARAAANREIFIEANKARLDNVRFAIEQAVRLRMDLNAQTVQMFGITQDTLRAAYQVEIAILNAHIDLYKADASVFEALVRAAAETIRAEIAKAEVYRAQIEAVRVQGEINEQRVRIYAALIDTIQTKVDIYTARVQAYEAELRGKAQLIERFKARVEAQRADVELDALRVEAYTSQVNAERAKAELYQAEVQGFAAEVGAFEAETRAYSADVSARAEIGQFRAQDFANQIRFNEAQFQAEIERYKTEMQRLGLLVEEARVNASREDIVMRGNVEAARAGAALVQANTAMAQDDTRMYLGNLQEAIRFAIAQSEAVARMTSQLAASTMSAVNISAGVSDSAQSSATQSSSFQQSETVSS
jgi:Mg2+ and Co2+ transporter CorA